MHECLKVRAVIDEFTIIDLRPGAVVFPGGQIFPERVAQFIGEGLSALGGFTLDEGFVSAQRNETHDREHRDRQQDEQPKPEEAWRRGAGGVHDGVAMT